MSNKLTQIHFEVVKFTLPSVSGTCTLGGGLGFGTPLTCDEATNSTDTFKFTNEHAPLIPESGIHRVIKSITETPTQLDPGKGLASRGSGSIVMNDFIGDPNPSSPAVAANEDIISQGTFFGKLAERNIMANRPLTIELHSETDAGLSYPTPFQSRSYLVESLENNGNGTWTLKFKDVLSQINFDEHQYPSEDDGTLRTSINASTTTIPVDTSTYAINDVILIGDEFMTVLGVANIGTGTATLTVKTRGSDVSTPEFSQRLTRTVADTHEAGDAIFKCAISDNQRIDDFLEIVLLDAGLDSTLITNSKPAWTAEVDEWQSGTRINTLWHNRENVNDVISSVTTDYLLDIWYDPTADLIKLSAISEWKQSNLVVSEGREITYNKFKYKADDQLRATRAFVVYGKRFLARSDDDENYTGASVFRDSILEGSDYYGKPKAFKFENSKLLDSASGDLLTKRYVTRFGLTPVVYNWPTEERFLNVNIGDVVDLDTPELQGFDGLTKSGTRAQILQIRPKYDPRKGRTHLIRALTYSPEFQSTDNIYRDFATMNNVNLFEEAGRPNLAVNLTFVFSNVKIGSTSNTLPAMRAGNFVAGSTITIIYINGNDHQSKGGESGRGGSSFFDAESSSWKYLPGSSAGTDGGTCYEDDGIATTIYLSGATGNATYPTADGYLRCSWWWWRCY
jgi:hypothetical protein